MSLVPISPLSKCKGLAQTDATKVDRYASEVCDSEAKQSGTDNKRRKVQHNSNTNNNNATSHNNPNNNNNNNNNHFGSPKGAHLQTGYHPL